MAQGMSYVVYLDSGCNKMILTSRKDMKYLERADSQMTTANKGTLTITCVGDAGNFKGVFYAPEASKNLVDIKRIMNKNCTSETSRQARHSSGREESMGYIQSA